jgi:hypothetical protein|tara:strand:+ start:275 stop:1435 length:1161 start_codon:yes stop_codon:yes gene_type:complete
MATTKVSGELVDLNEATSESGLKIPSGTEVNRPATDVAGMVRNNTNETSDSSASCEEYYNGAAWKKINNVAIPVYFKTIAFTGNGATQSITGFGFQPDFVWIKSTSGNTYSHVLTDSTRGTNSQIYSNDSGAATSNANNVTSFDSDGFSVGSNTNSNASAANYLAYCWKANGGTTSSNTDGSITSTVQANTAAGFSIVKWIGTQVNDSIGHGLNSAPELLILKDTSNSYNWYVYTKPSGATNNLRFEGLNTNSAATTANSQLTTTSTLIENLTTFASLNTTGANMLIYAFHSVAGYSKIGTYTGTGSSNSITGLGFQPSWVMIKCTTAAEDWPIFSSALPNNYVAANSGATAQSFTFSFDSDGFTVPASSGMTNGSGQNYIYMAFK